MSRNKRTFAKRLTRPGGTPPGGMGLANARGTMPTARATSVLIDNFMEGYVKRTMGTGVRIHVHLYT
jgi:hypothetical protein